VISAWGAALWWPGSDERSPGLRGRPSGTLEWKEGGKMELAHARGKFEAELAAGLNRGGTR
jgi:hypothetical protein